MTESQNESASISRDRSFWGMTITQFLAVFNDNFYKQTVLFVCIAQGSSEGLQGVATIVFSLPFILFSGICGYLSDLLSKRAIIVISKIAEIIIMFVGLIAFYYVNITLMMVVLFLMGVHSTLYAPAKYGLLPELFSENQLPKVNGLFQMTMFLAIILGLSSAGIAYTQFHEPWMTTLICMIIAGLGFFSALLIRPTPIARPGLKFNKSDVILNRETRKVIFKDKRLLSALLATSAFWATGGLVYPPAINDLGIIQFGLEEQTTSFLAAGTGIGIAIGCIIGMVLSHGRFNAKLIRVGSWGMFLGLIALALPGPRHGTFLGVAGSAVILVWLGICAGIYNVPLQVFIQARAPEEHKGRVIGAMNLANWIGIYFSGILYLVVNPLIQKWEVPYNLLFGAAALFFLPIVLFYRPKSEVLRSNRPLEQTAVQELASDV